MRSSTQLLGLAAAALVLPLALTACSAPSPGGSAEPSGDTVTIESAYGEVSLPKNPKRVAGISYDTPWQLMSLDVKPVATLDYSAWPDAYSDEQLDWIADAQTVGTFSEVNFEALATAQPDLIVGDAYEVDESTYKRLSEIAPTVIVGGGVRGDWSAITEQTATALGRHDVWEKNRDSYEKTRDDVKSKYADVIAQNAWVNFSLGNEAGQFSVQLPSGGTGNLVVNEMGLKYGPKVPVEDTNGSGYASLAPEQLGTVFDGVTAALTFANRDGAIIPQVQEIIDTPLFQQLDVAKSGQVYGIITQVTDHRTAQLWVEELESKVLEPLSR